ncbi:hypothetical protein FB567DRAFT_607183 [Paraphoma chrysanthemicola]|uniref:DUF6604 domain-containing protein n=1 Tax=Paraphoma chrysanthemicola TaxID=798071 RepID=A0A8K0VV83_9PLEO|nr:hypothetical protein FB567DRAFT_607183 [Paraphoma chrysanthemicola]
MLPKNLLSTYQQYKNDTDNVASWLATTAKRLGFEPASGSGSKKRKKAKSNSSKASPLQSGRKTYTVPIKDFTVLAEYLARQDDPPVKVPVKFGALLDRAISTRESYSSGISRHLPPDVEKQQSDDRHMFFLDILKSVRDILKPRYADTYVPLQKESRPMNNIQNIFANLEVEDTSDAFQHGEPSSTTTKSGCDQTEYRAERPIDDEEDFLEFRLLLRDLNELRDEVEATWKCYRQGEVDLVTVSITTNTAVDLARALEQQHEGIFERHDSPESMLQFLFNIECEEANTTQNYRERPKDDLNMEMYETADVMLWIPYIILLAFLPLLDLGYLPEFTGNPYGIRNPADDRSKMTARERMQEDKMLIFDMLPEFLMLARKTVACPTEDEFTRGLRLFFMTKHLPLWVCFATQIYIDIHNVLREKAGEPFRQLANITSHTRDNIRRNLDFHKDLSSRIWPKENDDQMRRISDELARVILGDPHRALTRRLQRKIREPYYFFRQHPWQCGLWQYNIQIQNQVMDIGFVNACGSVMYCAHLYNAVRKENLLTTPWPDMDLALELRSPTDFFVSGVPDNPKDYLTRFILAAGFSAANFSSEEPGRRKKDGRRSRRGRHMLKELAPVLQTFKQRYCENHPRMDLRAEDVEHILTKGKCPYTLDEDGYPVDIEAELPASIPASDKPRAPPKTQMKMVSLLSILRASIHSEILELSFDYLTLHRTCWPLLRALKAATHDPLVEIFGPQYITRETQLPLVVGYIFMTATSEWFPDAEYMQVKLTEEVSGRLLGVAAGVLGDMLTAEGGKKGSVVVELFKGKFGFLNAFVEEEGEKEQEDNEKKEKGKEEEGVEV